MASTSIGKSTFLHRIEEGSETVEFCSSKERIEAPEGMEFAVVELTRISVFPENSYWKELVAIPSGKEIPLEFSENTKADCAEADLYRDLAQVGGFIWSLEKDDWDKVVLDEIEEDESLETETPRPRF